MAALLLLAPCIFAILLAPSPPIASGAAEPAAAPQDLGTEEGLRRALDAIEQRYEAACVTMNEALWDAARRSGPTADRLETARAGLAAVYTDPQLGRILDIWTRRRTVTRDPSLSRRVLLWGRTRETAGVELDAEIFGRASALAERLRGARYTLDGRMVTRADLELLLSTSADRDLRRRAWLALSAPADEVRADVKRLLRARALKSQPTDRIYFHHLAYGGRELEAYWAYALMQQTAAHTRPQYDALLASLKKAVGLVSLEPWDLDYALARRTSQRGLDKALAEAFPPGGAIPAARRLLDALGFDPNIPAIRVEDPGIGSGEILPLAVRIPDDVRILADGATRAGGPRAYESVFRAYGRALQSAYNGQTAPMLKGYEIVAGMRNEAYAEGMAEAFGAFTRDPIFLEKYLGMDRKSIAIYLEDEADRALVRLRELLLNMGIEFAFCVNPDADLDQRFRKLRFNALGISDAATTAAPWPATLSFVTRPGADLDRIIALTIAPEFHARLRETFGQQRLGSGKTASWLIERCFAGGELVAFQDRLLESIRGGMDFGKHLDTIGVPLAQGSSP